MRASVQLHTEAELSQWVGAGVHVIHSTEGATDPVAESQLAAPASFSERKARAKAFWSSCTRTPEANCNGGQFLKTVRCLPCTAALRSRHLHEFGFPISERNTRAVSMYYSP